MNLSRCYFALGRLLGKLNNYNFETNLEGILEMSCPSAYPVIYLSFLRPYLFQELINMSSFDKSLCIWILYKTFFCEIYISFICPGIDRSGILFCPVCQFV